QPAITETGEPARGAGRVDRASAPDLCRGRYHDRQWRQPGGRDRKPNDRRARGLPARAAAARGGREKMTAQAKVERLHVELGDRSYDIVIGPGLIGRAGADILPLMRRRQAVIVTDETVARHHLRSLCASFDRHGIAHREIVLPCGEATKDLGHFGRLVEDILAGGIERATMLVAL